MAGPGLKVFESRQQSIAPNAPAPSIAEKLANLKNNKTVRWVVRLIAFDPDKHPELFPKALVKLGTKEQKFTFVADYEELRGKIADEAIQVTGGSVPKELHHVSAIIFPLRTNIYPANARGLLQVVNSIENNNELKIEKPFKELKQVSSEQRDNLIGNNSHATPSYAWDNYKKYYHQFCDLALELVHGQFDVNRYLSDMGADWSPLGFAANDPSANVADKAACDVADWDKDVAKYKNVFGARAFLIENLEISEIRGVHLIDFDNPGRKRIPEILDNKMR